MDQNLRDLPRPRGKRRDHRLLVLGEALGRTGSVRSSEAGGVKRSMRASLCASIARNRPRYAISQVWYTATASMWLLKLYYPAQQPGLVPIELFKPSPWRLFLPKPTIRSRAHARCTCPRFIRKFTLKRLFELLTAVLADVTDHQLADYW